MTAITDKRLTVVIPAYNVERYIQTCLDSVLCQRPVSDLLHVVVVVDGATDSTLLLTQEYAKKHPDLIKVVSQDNQGLSAARNSGIRHVQTEYVTFLDGDDIWLAGYGDLIYPLVEEGSVDLIEYDATMIKEDGEPMDLLKIAIAPDEIPVSIGCIDFLRIFRCYAWARVYRTDLVRKKLFPVGRRFEDIPTVPWHYWNSSRTVSIGKPLVGYRQRPQSILKNPVPQDVVDIAFATGEAAKMFRETGDPYWQNVAHRAFQQACRRVTWQPLATWAQSTRIARVAIEGVPAPPGFARWLQLNATRLYVVLLFAKRKITGT